MTEATPKVSEFSIPVQWPTLADEFEAQSRDTVRGNVARTNHGKDRDLVARAANLKDTTDVDVQIGRDTSPQAAQSFGDCLFLHRRIAILIEYFHQNFKRKSKSRLSSLCREGTPPQSPH